MRIKGSFMHLGKTINVTYEDADSFDALPYEKVRQVYGVCFCNGKLVIGFGGQKNDWGLLGGTVELNEKYEETLAREIQEESNMQVTACWPIGSQYLVNEDTYQIRYACLVKPLGEFTGDPDGGSIKKIKLINPADYKKYIDWGKIGDRIIARAIGIIKSKTEK
jgi:ADP-ribose pyrophosphatase YjhB (NUDIX family)